MWLKIRWLETWTREERDEFFLTDLLPHQQNVEVIHGLPCLIRPGTRGDDC